MSGSVDFGGDGVAHQQAGVGGCKALHSVHDGARGFRSDQLGLTNSCSLHQQNGRYSLQQSMQRGFGAVGSCSCQPRLGESKLASKGPEPAGGHVVQGCHRHMGGGLVTRGCSDAVEQVVHSHHGHVCQLEVPCSRDLLQLVPGSSSCEEGCFLSGNLARPDLLLSTSSSHKHGVGKACEGQGEKSYSGCAQVASQCVVVAPAEHASGFSPVGVLQESALFPPREEASLPEPIDSLSSDRQQHPLSSEAQDLLNADIRSGTKNVYRARFNHFDTYCTELGVDPTTCTENVIVNFLTKLRKTFGYKYQTVSGYRSAISKYHLGLSGVPVGQTKNVKRLTRAVFIEDPPLARYASIWPVDKVLDYLATLYPHADISIQQLGMKTLTLLSLASISRTSSVALLGPDLQMMGDDILFSINGLEKTSRPGHVRSELVIPVDSTVPALDISACCQDYLARTVSQRDYYAAAEGSFPARLFISNNKASCP